jgi:hypothetical protein
VLAATTAQAATITAEKMECSDIKDCYAIRVTGKIEQDDFLKFEKVIKDHNIKTGAGAVYLDSPGGLLVSGLIMGFIVHKYEFATVVGHDAYCISVCASLWLAGKQKFVSQTGHVGFHQPYYKDRRGNPHADPKSIALMKEYYAKIGVPKPAADFFLTANPKDAYWLNRDLASGFDLDVETLDAPKKDEPKAAPKSEVGTATLPKDFIDQLTSKKPL